MTTSRAPDELQFSIGFGGDATVVAVSGQITPTSAPTLETITTGLADRGSGHLVLDLGGVTFMDAASMAVLASIATRAALAAGRLTIRGATAPVQRLLDIALAWPRVAPPPADRGSSARLEQQRRSLAGPIGAGPHVMSRDMVRLGARSSYDIVDAALRSLTLLAGASLPGADGASVTLERHGRLGTVAATNGTILRMDAHQYNTGEGPCLAAGAHGQTFYVESLAEEQRWPSFVPRAIAEGIASILSTPVTIAKQTVGALNIYSSTERAFGSSQHQLADVFAAEASAILGARTALDDDELADQIAVALQSREIIALARGVLMAQSHITADEAAAALIRSARATDITVLEEAAEVVAAASGDAETGDEPPHRG